MKALFLFLFVMIAQQAQAADLLHCQTTTPENLTSELRIYETDSGLLLDVSTCHLQFLAHVFCDPYSKSVPVLQKTVSVGGQEVPTLDFTGVGIRVVSLYKEFRFEDSSSGEKLVFPEEDCQFSNR